MVFCGSSAHFGELDLTKRETAVLTVVMAVLLFTGLFPGGAVHELERVTRVNPNRSEQPAGLAMGTHFPTQQVHAEGSSGDLRNDRASAHDQ
jgi:hypothetical protein